MEQTLYDKNGEAVAYLSNDFQGTIYLWDGTPIGYFHERIHLYGINGKHLGFFIDDIIYDNDGLRQGFTAKTCPVPVGKEAIKQKKKPLDELKPKWAAPPMANLTYNFADPDFAGFLAEGKVEFTLVGTDTDQSSEPKNQN